jgi:hypothetical protein
MSIISFKPLGVFDHTAKFMKGKRDSKEKNLLGNETKVESSQGTEHKKTSNMVSSDERRVSLGSS